MYYEFVITSGVLVRHRYLGLLVIIQLLSLCTQIWPDLLTTTSSFSRSNGAFRNLDLFKAFAALGSS
jgi:hypothetical protein